jgi:hypothetical protein
VVGVSSALSAAGRAAIAKAAKKRWAKVRKQAKKVALVVATSGVPDCADYCLGLERLVSYIQRRQFSGRTPLLPNQPANIPNRMAVPNTKTHTHPIHSAVNIKPQKSGYARNLSDAITVISGSDVQNSSRNTSYGQYEWS